MNIQQLFCAWHRLARENRGSAMVEFALVAAVLVPLVTGTFQFGYSLYEYNKIENAVRAGAHYASLQPYHSRSDTPTAEYVESVRNMVIYANPNGGTQPVIAGLTPSAISVTMTMEESAPAYVRVGINNFQIDAVLAKFNLSGKPFASYRYAGRFAP